MSLCGVLIGRLQKSLGGATDFMVQKTAMEVTCHNRVARDSGSRDSLLGGRIGLCLCHYCEFHRMFPCFATLLAD